MNDVKVQMSEHIDCTSMCGRRCFGCRFEDRNRIRVLFFDEYNMSVEFGW